MAVNSNFTHLIGRQKESGLTVKMFCSNEGITPSTFYYWQRKIRKEEGVNRFIPLVNCILIDFLTLLNRGGVYPS